MVTGREVHALVAGLGAVGVPEHGLERVELVAGEHGELRVGHGLVLDDALLDLGELGGLVGLLLFLLLGYDDLLDHDGFRSALLDLEDRKLGFELLDLGQSRVGVGLDQGDRVLAGGVLEYREAVVDLDDDLLLDHDRLGVLHLLLETLDLRVQVDVLFEELTVLRDQVVVATLQVGVLLLERLVLADHERVLDLGLDLDALLHDGGLSGLELGHLGSELVVLVFEQDVVAGQLLVERQQLLLLVHELAVVRLELTQLSGEQRVVDRLLDDDFPLDDLGFGHDHGGFGGLELLDLGLELRVLALQLHVGVHEVLVALFELGDVDEELVLVVVQDVVVRALGRDLDRLLDDLGLAGFHDGLETVLDHGLLGSPGDSAVFRTDPVGAPEAVRELLVALDGAVVVREDLDVTELDDFAAVDEGDVEAADPGGDLHLSLREEHVGSARADQVGSSQDVVLGDEHQASGLGLGRVAQDLHVLAGAGDGHDRGRERLLVDGTVAPLAEGLFVEISRVRDEFAVGDDRWDGVGDDDGRRQVGGGGALRRTDLAALAHLGLLELVEVPHVLGREVLTEGLELHTGDLRERDIVVDALGHGALEGVAVLGQDDRGEVPGVVAAERVDLPGLQGDLVGLRDAVDQPIDLGGFPGDDEVVGGGGVSCGSEARCHEKEQHLTLQLGVSLVVLGENARSESTANRHFCQ